MELLNVYKYGILSILKLLLISFACIVVTILMIITLPVWWLEYIRRFLDSFDKLIEDIIHL